ncbi:MAG TPA: hypothetical protein VJ803_09690 [Gemmatimonadaceae bacterium]|nr:hypothetical protein [Gemmatimonadaceae bacterium]
MKARPFLVIAGIAALSACGDPTNIDATFETVEDTLTVFAFTGTPINVPTALNTLEHIVVRAEAGTNFDVVFDIDAGGQALILPPRVVSGIGNAAVTRSDVAYDALLLAPTTGYVENEQVPIDPGDVIVVRSVAGACVGRINQFIYSKLAIDSVNLGNRTIHFRMRVNPNCGFRSFAPGIPRE